ncbi:MAG TPA: hypothetical protein VH594_25200 [Trebonia sp.]
MSGAGCCLADCTALTNARTTRPRAARSSSICTVTTTLADWLAAVMSPNPTVLNTVTVKYSPSVRVSVCVLKFAGLASAMMTYAEANISKNNGSVVASASIARIAGKADRPIICNCKTVAMARITRPTTSVAGTFLT